MRVGGSNRIVYGARAGGARHRPVAKGVVQRSVESNEGRDNEGSADPPAHRFPDIAIHDLGDPFVGAIELVGYARESDKRVPQTMASTNAVERLGGSWAESRRAGSLPFGLPRAGSKSRNR